MPARHPDDDLLADLAADVLSPAEARAVEAHVLSCRRCAALLDDAERVRSLLLADDPGPVPADVWQRIEAALAAEPAPGRGSGSDSGNGNGSGSHPQQVADPVADTAAFQAFVDAPAPTGRPGQAPGAGSPGSADDGSAWSDDDDPLDTPDHWGGPVGVPHDLTHDLPRSRTGGGSTRRDARDTSRPRRGPVLLVAAAAVAIVAVIGAVRLAGHGSGSEAALTAGVGDSSASSSAPARATASTLIVRSGRNYDASTLGTASGKSPAPPAPASGAAPRADPPQPSGARSLASAARVAPDPAAGDITNPTRLAACLTALGVSQDRLVSVDLATYEGREAAVLVLVPAEGAGHEVWAVERTCARGAEGALNYVHVPD